MIGSIEYQYDSQTNAVATVTLAAPGVGFHWALHELIASYSGTVAAADLTITGLEDTWSHTIEVPASDKGINGVLYEPRGMLVGLEDTAVVVSLPAGGVGVVGNLGVVARKSPKASL